VDVEAINGVGVDGRVESRDNAEELLVVLVPFYSVETVPSQIEVAFQGSVFPT
jgi:hypothetical protein